MEKNTERDVNSLFETGDESDQGRLPETVWSAQISKAGQKQEGPEGQ